MTNTYSISSKRVWSLLSAHPSYDPMARTLAAARSDRLLPPCGSFNRNGCHDRSRGLG